MQGYTLWLGVAAALLFFWAVGAHNRLVRLRAAVRNTFAALDEQLVRQLVWVQGCVPEELRSGVQTLSGEPQDDTRAAWARVLAASEQFAVALAQARNSAFETDVVASLVMAHEAMRTAWSQAMANAVSPDAVPSADRRQERWMRLLHQAVPLRTAFNDAAKAHNEAIAQFPASLAARAMRYRPVGTLTRLADGR